MSQTNKNIKKALPVPGADGVLLTAPEHIEDNSPIEPLVTTSGSTQAIAQKIMPPPNIEASTPEYVSPQEKERRHLAYETQMTKGIFRNFEKPGQAHEFTMRLVKGPVQRYKLYDGQVHELPRNVANYIKTYCWYPEHQDAVDEFGQPSHTVGKKVYRFYFDNGEYTEDTTPSLISTLNYGNKQFLPNKNILVQAR